MKYVDEEILPIKRNNLNSNNKKSNVNNGKNNKFKKSQDGKHIYQQKNLNFSKEEFFSKIHAPQKRKKSSEKERQRNLEIKAALSKLSRLMPFVQKDLSRIRTLRLAKEYIKHLKRILQGETIYCEFTGCERPLALSDFERIVHRELQTNNSYKDRADLELASSQTSSVMSNENLINTPSSSFFDSCNNSNPLSDQTISVSNVQFPINFNDIKERQKYIFSKTNYQHFLNIQNNSNKLNSNIFNNCMPCLNFQHQQSLQYSFFSM